MNGPTVNANRRILVVSDPGTVHSISHAIRSLGDVVLCESAAAALEALAQEPFDCIVSSMTLPDMHATELLGTLRSRDIRAPVLVVADPSNVSDTVAAMRAGAHHVVAAPPYAGSLRDRVAKVLR